MKILRCAKDNSVYIRIGIILKGVAVRLHAKSARKETLFIVLCPKGTVSGIGSSFIKVVPEKDGFQARGSGFLWSRAQKGWFSGTGSGFLWSRARKGWFSGTVQTPFCPAVPKCPVRRRIPSEVWKGSVQFCRTSTVIGVIWQKSTEVRKE